MYFFPTSVRMCVLCVHSVVCVCECVCHCACVCCVCCVCVQCVYSVCSVYVTLSQCVCVCVCVVCMPRGCISQCFWGVSNFCPCCFHLPGTVEGSPSNKAAGTDPCVYEVEVFLWSPCALSSFVEIMIQTEWSCVIKGGFSLYQRIVLRMKI